MAKVMDKIKPRPYWQYRNYFDDFPSADEKIKAAINIGIMQYFQLIKENEKLTQEQLELVESYILCFELSDRKTELRKMW